MQCQLKGKRVALEQREQENTQPIRMSCRLQVSPLHQLASNNILPHTQLHTVIQTEPFPNAIGGFHNQDNTHTHALFFFSSPLPQYNDKTK